MMIETIAAAYEQYGHRLNMGQLIDVALNMPQDSGELTQDFIADELDLRRMFFQFIGTRSMARTRQLHSAFGTERWQTTAYEPVYLSGSADTGGLKTIPFVEFDEDKLPSPRAYGVFVTHYPMRRVMNHILISHPERANSSTHIGRVRREVIEATGTGVPAGQRPRGSQQKFGRFLRELIQFDGPNGIENLV